MKKIKNKLTKEIKDYTLHFLCNRKQHILFAIKIIYFHTLLSTIEFFYYLQCFVSPAEI